MIANFITEEFYDLTRTGARGLRKLGSGMAYSKEDLEKADHAVNWAYKEESDGSKKLSKNSLAGPFNQGLRPGGGYMAKDRVLPSSI